MRTGPHQYLQMDHPQQHSRVHLELPRIQVLGLQVLLLSSRQPMDTKPYIYCLCHLSQASYRAAPCANQIIPFV
ncbi:hypothetical protein Bca4012_017782 [Brassica carinata]